MGTTADKLQAILDSKTAIKTAINNKGGSITDNTPLDEYATEIDNLPSIDSLIDGTITTIDSNVTKIKAYAFYRCVSLTTANFPETTLIYGNAFDGCSGLTSINIPKIVIDSTQINCFRNCSSLTSIQLDEMTYLPQGTFSGCSNLTTVILKKAAQIGVDVFRNCISLSSLTLNYNGVVSIYANSFTNVTGPITVYVPASQITNYQQATNWSTLYNNNTVTFVAIS